MHAPPDADCPSYMRCCHWRRQHRLSHLGASSPLAHLRMQRTSPRARSPPSSFRTPPPGSLQGSGGSGGSAGITSIPEAGSDSEASPQGQVGAQGSPASSLHDRAGTSRCHRRGCGFSSACTSAAFPCYCFRLLPSVTSAEGAG